MHTFDIMEIRLIIMTMRKNNTFCNIKKSRNTKEDYLDGSKSMRRKVGFAVVITDTTRRRAVPEEDFIHTTKEIFKRKDKRWVIFRDSQSSIKYNKEKSLYIK